MWAMAHPRAGQPALPEDLIDVDAVISAYYDLVPDPSNPDQQVVFGTSGHRGSSLDTAFNDAHIAATTQAIVEYRASQGITGPLFIGKDTHALSTPAWTTAIEVLVANGVTAYAADDEDYTPTPAVSRAIVVHNATASAGNTADGIVVTRRTTRPGTVASSTTHRMAARRTATRRASSPPVPMPCWRMARQSSGGPTRTWFRRCSGSITWAPIAKT
jgi:alpha-D-glucose phosphate-specific phosphoglucomutase